MIYIIKKIRKVLLLFALVGVLFQPLSLAYAAQTPYLEVVAINSNEFRITVSSADAYRSVDLVTRQEDSTMWTTYGNIGSTNGSGYFSTTMSLNSFRPELTRISYVTVNGRDSNTVYTSPYTQPSFSHTPLYKNGSLILDERTVYSMYRGHKIGFANAASFTGLGYVWTNLYGADIDSIPGMSYTVNSANEHHPWGSWVLWDRTIYFVHETGLIPITSYDIFLNNGGENRFIVPMNWYDWQLPQLSFMVYGDSRLQNGNASADHTLWVTYGGNFFIELEANSGAGYSWDVNYDSYYVRLVARTYKPYSNLVGSSGAEQFEFQALQRGQVTITFSYRRSWESVTPMRREVYTIIIQ